jgi:hypothetical protein
MPHPLNHESFEYWMEMEKHYAALEYQWAEKRDFTWAERCRKLRWRCMELALDSLGA